MSALAAGAVAAAVVGKAFCNAVNAAVEAEILGVTAGIKRILASLVSVSPSDSLTPSLVVMMRSLLFRPVIASAACGLSLLFASPFLVTAADPVKLPQGMEQVTSVEGITEYRLQNGLGVLLFPDSTKPTVTVNITYKVGSRHEGYGEKGMAHLLEHLLFKGTPTRPSISQELTERGARANGTTWYDRTNYYETVHSTDDNLRWALGLEADRMINANVAKSDLVSEFSVVRSEYVG